VASSLAITTVAHFFEQTQAAAEKLPEFDLLGLPTAARRLSTAVQEANNEILAISKTSDKHQGMGTTIVAILFDVPRRRLHIAYVGDSRCYRLRDGRMELLTFDHSLINDVLELRPNIDDARVKKLPQNVITRALGMSDNLRVSVRSHDLLHGDRYLLCSDGLSDVVDDHQMAEALGLNVDCDEQVALLVNMALESSAQDNLAVVIVDCALPGSSAKAATRPMKSRMRKASRPKLPRLTPADRESVPGDIPEIAAFDRKSDRDSSPSINVVPAEAGSEEMAEALQDVMTPDVHDEPTPAELLPSPEENKGGRYKIVNEEPTDEGVAVRKKPTPAPTSQGRLGLPGARRHPTMPDAPKSKKKPGRAYSAPRLNKPDVSSDAPVDSRSGDTRRPPSSPPDTRIPMPSNTRTRRPEAAVAPASPALASALERFRQNPPDDRATIPGTPPPPRKPLPPQREPLATSEFTGDGDDAIPCHACGSVISQRAEFCMYCGATTGFVVPKK
jgi:protein phosphatase